MILLGIVFSVSWCNCNPAFVCTHITLLHHLFPNIYIYIYISIPKYIYTNIHICISCIRVNAFISILSMFISFVE